MFMHGSQHKLSKIHASLGIIFIVLQVSQSYTAFVAYDCYKELINEMSDLHT